MSPGSVADWLDYQQRLHPQGIALGLERVSQVWQRLAAERPPLPRVISVAGTNGKGSCVHALAALAAAAGKRCGRYTSPHLYRYNERIVVDGQPIDDAALCAAFAAVEQARGDIALTFFEFGTLAALWHFAGAGLDLVLLEVGLGGRLDATNIIDADVAVLLAIGRDHEAWLGSELAGIAAEKAGITRAGRPAIVGDAGGAALYAPALARRGVQATVCGQDYQLQVGGAGPGRLAVAMQGPHCDAGLRWEQSDTLLPANLAAAVQAWQMLDWGPAPTAALAQLAVPGRCERRRIAEGELILDVAHNGPAAQRLADWLAAQPPAEQALVIGVLADKSAADIVAPLAAQMARIEACDLPPPRGAAAKTLLAAVPVHCQPPGAAAAGPVLRAHAGPAAALAAAREWAATVAGPARIIICGSFQTLSGADLD